MAFLARHDGVPPDQRKSCNVMIEGRHATPIVLAVTRLAAAAELTVVPVVLAVTGYAGRPQLVAIQIASMACIAFYLCVAASERKFCRLVMVEADGAPLVLIMARFALCAVPSAVDVLNLVAGDTRSANSLVAFAAVACRTWNVAMRAPERKLGLVVVVWFDATPRRLTVAILALFPKATLMRVDRLMAVEAAPRGIAKLHRLQMTAATRCGLVRLAQLEIRKGVIECLAIELHDVGISPLVIGVAMRALLLCRIWLSSVQPPVCKPISRDFFMACQA
jgi:hypothetical protein